MGCALIGDRFVQHTSGRWLDLATGECVVVHVSPLPPDWPSRESQCAQGANDADVIDVGRVGTTDWYEARAADHGQAARAACADATVVEEVRDVVDHVRALAASMEAPGVHVAYAPVTHSRAAVAVSRAIARQLRRLGVVSIRAGLDLPRACVGALEHRHLAILLVDDRARPDASRWISRLVSVSNRGHLLVDLTGGRPRPQQAAPIVRDRDKDRLAWANDDDRGVERAGQARMQLRRACGAVAHGRHRDAELWFRAAIASSLRHHDLRDHLRAAGGLVPLLLRRDAWETVRSVLEQLLRLPIDQRTTTEIRARLAGVLIALGDLERADAILAAANAEAAANGDAPSPMVTLRLAELRFWQGRFEEAAQVVTALPASVSAVLLEGLVAWAIGDADAVSRALVRATALGGGDESDVCRVALVALSGAMAGDVDEVVSSAAVLVASARRVRDPRLGRLGRAIASECLTSVGRTDTAARAIGPDSLWRRAPTLDRWLFQVVSAAADAHGPIARSAEHARAGAHGISRWGTGRRGMHLVHAIPTVLELVQDAEDELAALEASSAWLRRACGADAAAFLAGDPSQVLVADGWSGGEAALAATEGRGRVGDGPPRGDLGVVVASAPVRISGVEVGRVVARGPVAREGTLGEAVRTLAVLCAPAVRARLDVMHASRMAETGTPEILGRSPAIAALRETIGRAAATPFAVLIEGESGTGKELVARAIHRLSPRRDRRFCAVNSAALSDDLVEAELFGHTRGAFTGAVGPRAGLFEEAHAGSLFLDEVGELSPRAQAKLLRVLQEREVRRVGENLARPVDVRVIAATNVPLTEAVRHGAFREDLLFRLAVVRIRLPALRDRIEDVPLLAAACWRRLVTETGKRALIGPDALAALCRHRWPGNVREFQNVMASLLVMAPARGRVTARHVDQVLGECGTAEEARMPLRDARTACERRAVTVALARHGGRRAPAARELGLTRQGLAKIMRRLGLGGNDPATGVA